MHRILSPLRWLGRNLGALLLAFALALVVWVSSVITADPNQECVIAASLDVLGQDTNLLFTGPKPDQISVRVRSLQSVCRRFSLDRNAVTAQLDISAIGEGQHTVPVQVQVEASYRPIRILEITPENLTFRLEALLTRTIPITFKVTGEAAPGYVAGLPVWSASRVVISGRKSLAEKVEDALVFLDLANANEDIQKTIPLELQDVDGNVITGLTLDPATVTVHQTIGRPGTFRDVTVKVITTGQPAEGYRLTNITPAPQVVTLFSADEGLLREMPGFVETMPIDLTGATDDIEKRVALVLPPGVSLFGTQSQSVLVQVGIAAIEASTTRTFQVEVIGLAPGLAAELSPGSVDVILFGPALIFDQLQPGDVRVVADVTGLEPGLYTIEPKVDIFLLEVTAESVLPATIEIRLFSAPTATPTPTPSPGTPDPLPAPTATSAATAQP